jgi:hypothetical protein
MSTQLFIEVMNWTTPNENNDKELLNGFESSVQMLMDDDQTNDRPHCYTWQTA